MVTVQSVSQLETLKPWPNGTNYSSQLESSYKIKTCIGGWPNDTAKSSQIARNRAIVWIQPRSHITITKQLGESWLEFGWGGQTVEKLARVGRKFELDQIQANSSQLEPTQAKWVAKRYPTPSKLWTWLELAWVGRSKFSTHFGAMLTCRMADWFAARSLKCFIIVVVVFCFVCFSWITSCGLIWRYATFDLITYLHTLRCFYSWVKYFIR